MKEHGNQPIDFVITWVDDNNQDWLLEREKYKADADMDDTPVRYRDLGTLKYVLRSIEKFAPWVRQVFLVTNGQAPEWLNLECKKLKLVKHSDFIPQEYLPTFNAQTIEWHLHMIEGLSEHFVYFNDDVILTDYVQPTDFFKNGFPKDTFGLGLIRPVELFSNVSFNNMLVLNKHFPLKETLRKNRSKFFSLKQGKILFRNIILSTRNVFYGMYEPHITLAFKKEYFDILWQKEGEWIRRSCQNKYRSKNDITIWLVRYWQMLNGDFEPRSARFGKYYSVKDFLKIKKLKKVRGQKVICINDSNSPDLDFSKMKKTIAAFLSKDLGKSNFEKGEGNGVN